MEANLQLPVAVYLLRAGPAHQIATLTSSSPDRLWPYLLTIRMCTDPGSLQHICTLPAAVLHLTACLLASSVSAIYFTTPVFILFSLLVLVCDSLSVGRTFKLKQKCIFACAYKACANDTHRRSIGRHRMRQPSSRFRSTIGLLADAWCVSPYAWWCPCYPPPKVSKAHSVLALAMRLRDERICVVVGGDGADICGAQTICSLYLFT